MTTTPHQIGTALARRDAAAYVGSSRGRAAVRGRFERSWTLSGPFWAAYRETFETRILEAAEAIRARRVPRTIRPNQLCEMVQAGWAAGM